MTSNITGNPSGNAAATQAALRAVEGALRAGNMARAAELADEAVGLGVEHPNLFTLAAYRQISHGDDTKALAYAKKAKALAPRSVDTLTVLGVAHQRLGHFRDALAAFDAALRQQPNIVSARFRKACVHEDLSELSRAKNEFERVLSLEPLNAEAMARLANLAALRGDVASVRDYGSRALKIDPRQQGAVIALATADIEERKFGDAFARISPLTADASTGPVNRAIAQSLAADALDGLGRQKEAFPIYVSAKALFREFYRPVYEAQNLVPAHARVENLMVHFEETETAKWEADAKAVYESPVVTHVFLVGFPRSGTTLLEAVLDSHQQVQAMEERDCLGNAAGQFLDSPESLDRFATLDEAALSELRNEYWKQATAFGVAIEKPVFVDKLPLNSILLPLVAKLFPRAKILFALRDPRDVVWSCFRRRFGMTQQMYELTTLDGTANYYDLVMRLCDIYRAKLGLAIHDLRYEDLVGDFAGTVNAVCTLLGIEPDASMEKFAVRAAARNIDTPSNAQVARGLFTQGVGQWRAYENELAPILPKLAPWVARFGYKD